jgi:hypothetical protein
MALPIQTNGYFQKPAARIINDIRTLSVPDYVLRDNGGLAMLSAFQALHPKEISNAEWSALCRFRSRLDACNTG